MKKSILITGIAVLTLLFGFNLLGCGNSTGPGFNPVLTLKQGGQVYDQDPSTTYIGTITFECFGGESDKGTLSTAGLDDVVVNGGQLDYTLRTPTNFSQAIDFSSMPLTADPPGAKVLIVSQFYTSGSSDRLLYYKYSGGSTTPTHQAIFLYSDKACTITGAIPESPPIDCNIDLNQGWNTGIIDYGLNTLTAGSTVGFIWVIE